MHLIAQGAEAKVYEEDNTIIKERLPKSYRIKEMDDKITKSRVKKECKILLKLSKLNIRAPKLIKSEGNSIFMEKVEGRILKDVLNDEVSEISEINGILKEVGELVANVHNAGIVHGDLTTLNFIWNTSVWIIDFGLSFFSSKDEDKATDLYVFEKAIKCAHKESCINMFFEGYRSVGSQDVLKRLETVRKRGRKREENAFG